MSEYKSPHAFYIVTALALGLVVACHLSHSRDVCMAVLTLVSQRP